MTKIYIVLIVSYPCIICKTGGAFAGCVGGLATGGEPTFTVQWCCDKVAVCVAVGLGILTDTWNAYPCSFACTSILYPGGRKVLKPTISSGCPLNKWLTLVITPGVSMLCDLNSFIISKKSLYTWN